MGEAREPKDVEWLPYVETLVQGIQSSTPTTKLFASLIIYGLASALVWFLWQKPTTPQADDRTAAAPPTGITSNNNSNIAGLQAGTATLTGSNSGTIAGVIINQSPPATDQQRREQISQLDVEIAELADNRNRLDLPPPNTFLETMVINRYARQLFLITDKYYKQILEGSKSGQKLVDFRRDYRTFFENEVIVENNIATFVGSHVETQFRDAWFIYVKYYILRHNGLSKETIISNGNFLNYSITWDDAERVSNLVSNNQLISLAVRSNNDLLNSVALQAKSILDDY